MPAPLTVDEEGGLTNVYTISDIEIETMREISHNKVNYLLNYSRLDQDHRSSTLKDILGAMQMFLETPDGNGFPKYFSHADIEKQKVNIRNNQTQLDKQYTFYELQAKVNEDMIDDREKLRQVAIGCFSIYDKFAGIIGQKIPTEKVEQKDRSNP